MDDSDSTILVKIDKTHRNWCQQVALLDQKGAF
ncbi:MAG: hypothetical protein AB2N28_4570 [Candidatus Phytoplasma solani]